MRFLLVALLVSSAEAQFGKRNLQRDAGSVGGGADVDLAMAGWEQLSKNPEKLQEVMESLKDPEVVAKAQEMLKDPEYMAAARSKLQQLEGKAKASGMLDANGQPASAAAGLASAFGGMGGSATGVNAAQAREWELENAERHRGGLLNDAELGLANLKNAMGDASMMESIQKMMQDPATMSQVKKMMEDPAFKAQAQQMVAGLKAQGKDDELRKLASQAATKMGASASASSEVERLRLENELLRKRVLQDEL